jgi:hypothetical protein
MQKHHDKIPFDVKYIQKHFYHVPFTYKQIFLYTNAYHL